MPAPSAGPAAEDENRRSWLLRKLLSADVGACEARVDVVDRFCDFYAEQGLFDGDRALALDCDCPSALGCWRGIAGEDHPPREQATVSVPWIGPGYEHGGVAAVAINFNNYGGLGAQWWIRRGANDRLRLGKRKPFDYRAGSYLRLVQASLAGELLEENPDPARVADAWDRSAFLESVKCSPRRAAGRPTDAMRQNCPTRYLPGELALLEAGVLVIIGRWVGDAVAALLAVKRTDDLPGFWRGSAELAGRELEVLCCNHPSYGHWRPAITSLRRTLTERPLSLS